MSHFRRLFAAALAGAVTIFGSVQAADWSRFRGPNGDGTSSDTIPLKWSKTENVAWVKPIPGKGNSSPIIVKGHLFVQSASADGSKRFLVCMDAATGDTKWTKSLGGQPSKTHAKSSLASSTPTCDGQQVYAIFWDGKAVAIHAFDMEGTEKWHASLGSYESQHGAGMSPVVHAGKVFVNFDQDDAAEIVAFDAKTGAKVWSKERKAYRACYSTPLVRELPGGKSEIVVFSTAGAAGYDPDNGTLNWNWAIPWQAGEMALRSVASPLLANGLLVCLTGDGSGTRYAAAIKPGVTTSVLWENRKGKGVPYVPCPVVKGEHIYWVTDQGVAECVELKTGKIVWFERAVNRAVSASPILVGDQLVIIDEGGKCVILKATPKGYDKLGDGDIGEATFASPAIANGSLYIRSTTNLYCIREKK